jgi:hypothetical protein
LGALRTGKTTRRRDDGKSALHEIGCDGTPDQTTRAKDKNGHSWLTMKA